MFEQALVTRSSKYSPDLYIAGQRYGCYCKFVVPNVILRQCRFIELSLFTKSEVGLLPLLIFLRDHFTFDSFSSHFAALLNRSSYSLFPFQTNFKANVFNFSVVTASPLNFRLTLECSFHLILIRLMIQFLLDFFLFIG